MVSGSHVPSIHCVYHMVRSGLGATGEFNRSADPPTPNSLATGESGARRPAVSQPRLSWRAIVHVLDRESVRTEWHMATCTAPYDPAAHCTEDRRLIATLGQPDGHCLMGGRCLRCGQ
jgi:hypothetical protein